MTRFTQVGRGPAVDRANVVARPVERPVFSTSPPRLKSSINHDIVAVMRLTVNHMELETLFGLPAHPLLVHAPVVLIPIAALLAVASLVPVLRRHTLVLAYLMAFVGGVSAILAASAGEEFQKNEQREALVREHIEYGDTAQSLGIALAIVAAIGLAHWWFTRKPANGEHTKGDPEEKSAVSWARKLSVVVVSVFALTSIAATVTIVQAGHSGAKSVWNEREGGEQGQDDD